MKKEIGNQMLSKKEVMWKRVCESLVKCSSERPGRTFTISMPRRFADLIKAMGDATKY